MGGDPSGDDRDDKDLFDTTVAYEQAFGGDPNKVRGQSYTVNGKERIPVLNEQGRQVGFQSAPAIPSFAAGAITALTGEQPLVYTGDPRYNPSANQGKVLQNFYGLDGTVEQRYVDPDGGGGGSSQPAVDPFAQQRAELAAARANRANALASKQAELASAFGAFSDDFYAALSSSYTDFQNPLMSQS